MGTKKKKKDFIEDPNDEILGSQRFRLGRLRTRATMLQEVGILPALVYSYFCGLIST